MTCPTINTLPRNDVRVLAPSSSFSSSSVSSSASATTATVSHSSLRLLAAASVPRTSLSPSQVPIMVMLTQNPPAQAQKKAPRHMGLFKNVEVDDSRCIPDALSRLRAENAREELIMSGKKQFEEEIPLEIRRGIEKNDASVTFQKGSYYYKRRRSFWAEMKMAIDATASTWEEMVLSWGISESLKLLLSVSVLKSVLRVINMLLLLLLMPFNGGRRHFAVALKSADEEEREKGRGNVKKEGSGLNGSSVKKHSDNALPQPVDLEVSMRREMAIQRVREDKDDTDKTVREFSLFVTRRGAKLFTQSWSPVSAKIKGLVVLLHGLNEHSGRYNDFAKQLNANGFKVYGLDWIGHGGSDGLHGYVHSLDDAVSDVKAFLDEVLIQNHGIPCFCFGHSTGGAILLKAALDPKVEAKINGLILTSPAIGVQPSHPIYTIIAPVVSILLPRYQCGAANKKGAVVSRDPEAVVAKYSDPLVYTGSLRARTGYEILRTSRYLQQNLRRLRVPLLVLHGTADVITNPEASEKLYTEASSTDKTIKLYEGLLHDLLFEPEREIVIHDIMKWLSERI